MDSKTLHRRETAARPDAPVALGRARFLTGSDPNPSVVARAALLLPLEERMATPRGPMLVRDYLRRTGRYACETHHSIEVIGIETITGHAVHATVETVFETPDGPKRARDLAPGDQVYFQSEAVTWNSERKLPCAVGTLRQWVPELGTFLARLAGASRWVCDEARERLCIAFPVGDLGRAVWTRERLAQWLGRGGELEERSHENVLTVSLAGAPSLAPALSSLFDPRDGFPVSLYQAPVDVVHAFVRTLLADRGIFEGADVRVRGTRALIEGFQEMLSYLGVLAVRWADDGTEQELDLILPVESLRGLPSSARPAGWPIDGGTAQAREEAPGGARRFLTTILRMRSMGSVDSFARLDGAGSVSLRGFLVAAS